MKIHKHIINHINKHRKKYIFGTSVAAGITALKLMAIVGVFLGISSMMGKSNVINEKSNVYETIGIFSKIDDIAHQEINKTGEENPFTTQKLKDEFYAIDTKYHNASNLNEEYRAEKEMVGLLEKVEENRTKTTGSNQTDLEKNNEYYELLMQFNKIK